MKSFKDKHSLIWILSFVVIAVIFIFWLIFLPNFLTGRQPGESASGEAWQKLRHEAAGLFNNFTEQKDVLQEKILPQLIERGEEKVSLSEEEVESLKNKILELKNNNQDKK
ncbi:MAG: hypothetical protein PHD51_04370 [Patescibacteria group bacterium]|nr:hypothetical protein [Patescibacteria group bacterium]MDD5490858.1 hypothetical protein [Patescibacteria group bacterium]